jgi:diguanylate cyclase (GGDEF)-like protein
VRLSRWYQGCREDDDPEIWAWRFVLSAWLASALWGSLGALIYLSPNPVVHLIVVGAQWSHLDAVFTRNSCEPRAALGQVALVKGPLAAACFSRMDGVYAIYGAMVVLGIVIARSTIVFLHQHTIDSLAANEALAASRDALEEANGQLEALATTDALTAMGNRRHFDLALRREWRRAVRGVEPISLLLLDLDHFKTLNDSLGHPAGDECLRRVGACIQGAVRRPEDVPTRIGGEEFAVVLPNTDAIAARHMAERVRDAVAGLRIPHPASAGGFVTVSVGAATALPDETVSAALLIQQADEALYRAKAFGRNCTVAAPQPAALAQAS